MVLKDIPADARPREKLLASGAGALADAELIALLLRTGLPGVSVLQLAQQQRDQFGIGERACAAREQLLARARVGGDVLQHHEWAMPRKINATVYRQALLARAPHQDLS